MGQCLCSNNPQRQRAVIALYPLMPNKMTVDRDSSGKLYYLYQKGSEDTPTLGSNSQVYLSPHDVLHIPVLGLMGNRVQSHSNGT
jgi:hypothetical protein